jgi:hypothetical protein
MIRADIKPYTYFTLGEEPDEYGQFIITPEPKGTIKIAIYTVSQATVDNIKYKQATYIGLTEDTEVNDTYIIEYGKERLKVLYVNGQGRYKQVFLSEV